MYNANNIQCVHTLIITVNRIESAHVADEHSITQPRMPKHMRIIFI